MPRVIALTGNHAVAYAVKLAKPDVIAAYPITPQSPIVEKLSEMIESGELKSSMIRVESEHSALAACFG
ncbi:MAG: pyruvate ferredoxin oxidoreductase, partial [Desulfurococcaceae archaeon]|nr:pyruvate ferredoxin oxidoreductase [Desulfurococcaceae archaeon]